MKNLDKFVKELSIEKKNQIVKGHYEKLMRRDIIEGLTQLNFTVNRVKEYPSEDKLMVEIQKGSYLLTKNILQELDLYDERYEAHYNSALKGELNLNELLKIK
jgi:hypothetical protein